MYDAKNIFIFINIMLASFQPARSNASIFVDSLSNDILLQGHSAEQRILFGFSSNNQSVLNISKSNLSIPNGGFYASNVGIGVFSPTTDWRLHVAGSAKIEGDLMVNGNMTYLNTDVQVTDQFSISNAGTGPALLVTQTGAQPIVEFRDDDKVVFTVADGGFVTIGSNNPATKLDVEGDTTVRGTIFTSNVNTSNVQTNSLSSVISRNYTTITSNLYSSNLIINNQVIIDSNGIITNSNFLPPLNTSNIVAGQFTSNFIRNDEIISSKLASNLVLKGTTTMSSNVTVSNGNILILGSNNFLSTGHQAKLYLGSNDYFVAASKDVGMVFQVPGTTYPVILENNSGFLGLGTMDPQENLHVHLNAKVDGSQYVMTSLGVGTSNPEKTVDIVGTTRASDSVYLLNDLHIQSNNGAWSTQPGRQLYMRYSTSTGKDAAVIQSIDRSNLTFYNMGIEGSNIAIGGSNSLSNPSIYVQYGGRVGLGTTLPTEMLQVSGKIYSDLQHLGNSNDSQLLPSFAFKEDSNTGIFHPSNDTLGFTTAGNEKMRIDTSGNVGIGTSNVLYKLDVVGDIHVPNNNAFITGNTSGLIRITSANSNTYIQSGLSNSSNSAAPLIFSTINNYTEWARFDSNGKFGLGTSNPLYQLDVVGDTVVRNGDNVTDAGGALYMGISAYPNHAPMASIKGVLYNTDVSGSTLAGGISFNVRSNISLGGANASSSTEAMRINYNGNVGIGTSNPLYKLDVAGNSRFATSTAFYGYEANRALNLIGINAVMRIWRPSGGDPSFELISGTLSNSGLSSGNTIWDVYTNAGNFLIRDRTPTAGNGAGRIMIDSTGKVGIGTSSPSFRLDIAGDVYASSNIRSSVGTLGPAFTLIPDGAYADVTVGEKLALNSTLEAGNPASNASMPLFYGNSYIYQDASGENMAWNQARLLFRGCPLVTAPSTTDFTIQDFVSTRTPQYSNITSTFTLSNPGRDFGYVTYATPWFPSSTSEARSIALNLIANSSNAIFRIGQVKIQFRT